MNKFSELETSLKLNKLLARIFEHVEVELGDCKCNLNEYIMSLSDYDVTVSDEELMQFSTSKNLELLVICLGIITKLNSDIYSTPEILENLDDKVTNYQLEAGNSSIKEENKLATNRSIEVIRELKEIISEMQSLFE